MERDNDARSDILGGAPGGPGDRPALRPRHCWEIVRQVPGLHFNCEECYAYFVQQDCWTLWALRRPGFKPCCQKVGDCTECVVLTERMRPRPNERLEIDRARPVRPAPASSKRICTYLQLYSSGEVVEGEGRNAAVTRAMQMRSADFRCRLRGVHLDMGYVGDVCVSRHVEDCVFLEETRPEVHVRELPMVKLPIEQAGGKRPAEKGHAASPPTDARVIKG
ncbi:MAG TPA: hypothetical protein VNL35_17360 [Chloroflexota bacterium]|nr:hypothetical protein [Chloroflexota bacterium]